MGVVYLAEGEGEAVALKVVRSDLTDDMEFRTRFSREVTAAATVQGRYTARYVASDTQGPQPWLATEYVPGETLARGIAARGPLDAERLSGLAAGLAAALSAIHSTGIVHRDLKPTNVILASDGPKVIDFGISRALEATALTRTSAAIGTPAWMSPEQVTGHDVGFSSDVFAWAATITFAATGRPPFGEGRPEAITYRIVHEQPDLTGVPGELHDIVASALSKSPDDRPTPTDLLATVTDLTVAATPGTSPDDAAATVVDRTWNMPAFQAAVERAEQPTRRRRVPAFIGGAAGVAILAGLVGGAGWFLARDDDGPDTELVAEETGTSAPPTTETASTTEATTTVATTTTTIATTTTAPPADDPLSFYTSDGAPPALPQECPGVLGYCLSGPAETALAQLGPEDERYGAASGGLARAWNLDGAQLTIESDEIDSISRMTLSVDSAPQPFRAALPDGLVLGDIAMADVAASLGEPHETDSLGGEGVTLYRYRYLAAEGTLVVEYTASIPWRENGGEIDPVDVTPEYVAEQPATTVSVYYRDP